MDSGAPEKHGRSPQKIVRQVSRHKATIEIVYESRRFSGGRGEPVRWVALRTEDAKKNTQARVAVVLGVARETVRDWFGTNGGAANTSVPKPDARVKVEPKASPPLGARRSCGGQVKGAARILCQRVRD